MFSKTFICVYIFHLSLIIRVSAIDIDFSGARCWLFTYRSATESGQSKDEDFLWCSNDAAGSTPALPTTMLQNISDIRPFGTVESPEPGQVVIQNTTDGPSSIDRIATGGLAVFADAQSLEIKFQIKNLTVGSFLGLKNLTSLLLHPYNIEYCVFKPIAHSLISLILIGPLKRLYVKRDAFSGLTSLRNLTLKYIPDLYMSSRKGPDGKYINSCEHLFCALKDLTLLRMGISPVKAKHRKCTLTFKGIPRNAKVESFNEDENETLSTCSITTHLCHPDQSPSCYSGKACPVEILPVLSGGTNPIPSYYWWILLLLLLLLLLIVVGVILSRRQAPIPPVAV